MNNTDLLEFVQRDRMELMMRAPFYSRIICSSELVFVRDPRVRIACTDYRRIYLSADSYPGLPGEQRLAVLAHEVLHIALRYAFRIGNREKNRFGIAADIEIHFLLRDTFQEPYRTKCNEDWKGLTAAQIYDLLPKTAAQPKSDHCYPGLKKENLQGTPEHGRDKCNWKEEGEPSQGTKPESPEVSGSGQQDGEESEASDGVESDSQMESGKNQQETASKIQEANRPLQKGSDRESQGSETENTMETEQTEDEISEFCPQFDSESEMDCRMLSEETMMDLKQQQGRGNAPAGIGLLIEKLSKPHLNWRVLLRQFVRLYRGGTYCWLPPNRRFIAKELYLPGRREKVFRGVVALDTSGSTMDALSKFVAELTNLLWSFGKFELTVIECDAAIQQVWKITSCDPLSDLVKQKFKGGGGTNFTPVFEYVKKHIPNPNVLIFFTDGDGTCPKEKPPYPVLWLLTKDGKAPVSWGAEIDYEEV